MTREELLEKCPCYTSHRVVSELLSGKWPLCIMFLLKENGTIRFNELQRMMPETMTSTTLSRQLKLLEDRHLIERRDYNEVPPKVEYSLSELGQEFENVIKALGEWAAKYSALEDEK